MLSVTPIVLLAVVVFLLIRKWGLRAAHAAVCALFGFYLASTSAAPALNDGLAKVTGLISGIDF
ncbi:hypothetical protein ACIHCQ_42300 [Streptomyces sp. NPDC052236]|uniref:hypothetical protein n=1 Tax=Streptomyces sp. NPDC052236 TaxID=3365686 RepID=UPI0037D6285D